MNEQRVVQGYVDEVTRDKLAKFYCLDQEYEKYGILCVPFLDETGCDLAYRHYLRVKVFFEKTKRCNSLVELRLGQDDRVDFQASSCDIHLTYIYSEFK